MSASQVVSTLNLTRVPSGRDRVRHLRQQRQQLGRTPPGQQLRGSYRQGQELLLQRTWHRRVQRKVWQKSLLFTHVCHLTRCCWLSSAVLDPSVKPQQTIRCFEIGPPLMVPEAFPINASKRINADVCTRTDTSAEASAVAAAAAATAGGRTPETKTGPSARLPTSAWNSKADEPTFNCFASPSPWNVCKN